jgi:AraC-like DNA-binding protein
MKISTKGRYALRLMLELATGEPNELLTIKKIAERQGISDKYLEQIITPESGRCVKSASGAQGGFRLSVRHRRTGPARFCADRRQHGYGGLHGGITHRSPAAINAATLDLFKDIDAAIRNVVDN